jgi:hypothetical protein
MRLTLPIIAPLYFFTRRVRKEIKIITAIILGYKRGRREKKEEKIPIFMQQ